MNRLLAIVCVILSLIVSGCRENRLDVTKRAEPTSDQGTKELNQRILDDVTPSEGFAYFSGNLNTNRSFPTIYYSDGFGDPRVTVLAPEISVEYPIKDLEIALRIFRLLCAQHAEGWKTNRDMMTFNAAYLRAYAEHKNGRGNIQLQDILKFTPKDQHEVVTRLFLNSPEGRIP